ncbi:MAG: AAA family ATPase [Alphaproteobacteria bacterium]|nr:AAA family ATPase [Alphaproteobacteria bacterium]
MTDTVGVETEHALLSALMERNARIEDCGGLKGEHFQDPLNGAIFEEVKKLYYSQATANSLTLLPRLEGLPVAEIAFASEGKQGLLRYLIEIEGAVLVGDAKGYARIIHDHARRRAATNTMNAALLALEKGELDVLTQVAGTLQDLAADANTDRKVFIGGDIAIEVAALYERRAKGGLGGPTTGFRTIDEMIGGFVPGAVTVLAGRPSMGKTAVALEMAVRSGQKGARSHIQSMEMSTADLASRAATSMAAVPFGCVTRGNLLPELERRYIDGLDAWDRLPIAIDERPVQRVGDVHAYIRHAQRHLDGLDVVYIDYLQLMGSGSENRVQEMSEITRGMKQLAKEQGIHIVLLSQLSRAVEQREDKRPMLADLRDSGSIEQDADNVIFLYRDEYYLERNPPQQKEKESVEKFLERQLAWEQRLHDSKGLVDLILAKARQAETATKTMRLDLSRMRLGDEI